VHGRGLVLIPEVPIFEAVSNLDTQTIVGLLKVGEIFGNPEVPIFEAISNLDMQTIFGLR
jgi:hypothetical protein